MNCDRILLGAFNDSDLEEELGVIPEDASILEFETRPLDSVSMNAYSRRSYTESHVGKTPTASFASFRS